jgi:hypothetical protein
MVSIIKDALFHKKLIFVKVNVRICFYTLLKLSFNCQKNSSKSAKKLKALLVFSMAIIYVFSFMLLYFMFLENIN